jgi:RND family efflux transporter MFP subunit
MKAFFIKYYIVISVIVVVVAAGSIYWYLKSSTPPSFSTATVTRGNVISSIDLPGNVLSQDDTGLSFQEGGQIAQVSVSEGDVVSAGATLATLDQSALTAGVEQANAALAAAQAQLGEIASGTRPQQLQIDQGDVTNAQAALGASIEGAYTSADDAIQNQTDNFYLNPETNNPLLIIPVNDSQTQNDIQNDRVVIGTALNTWYLALTSTSTDPSTLASMSNSALQQVDSYLDTVALVINDLTPSSGLSAATIAQYKVDVVTARDEVTAAVNTLTAAESALQTAQSQLILAQAGATPQDIATQQAVVLEAQAALASAQVALSNATLVAPFSGTVQDLTAVVGQVVTPGAPVLTLVNNNGLKLTTYIPENDLGSIKIGDTADVTFDAYSTGTVFSATVQTIDSVETQVNGSAAYQVTLYFVNPDSRIQSGMTANVHIITAEDDNVLEVPSLLVINSGNNYFVLVKNGNAVQQVPVTIGIVGNNGMTEITSGLTEGEQITNF